MYLAARRFYVDDMLVMGDAALIHPSRGLAIDLDRPVGSGRAPRPQQRTMMEAWPNLLADLDLIIL